MAVKVGIQKIYDELLTYDISKYDIATYTEGGKRLTDMARFYLTQLNMPVQRIDELFFELDQYGIEKVFAHRYDEEHSYIDEEEEELIQDDEENAALDDDMLKEDVKLISEYLIQINDIYEKCIVKLEKHIPDERQCNKIFHTIYKRWGLSLLSDRFDEFNEIFGQMYTPTTDHIALTLKIMDEFEEKPNMLKLYEEAIDTRRARREDATTEVKCREEAGEISTEKAQALLTSYEHLNEWELVESAKMDQA